MKLPVDKKCLTDADHVWVIKDYKNDVGICYYEGLLKKILRCYMPEEKIFFTRDALGKPKLVGGELYFNISHSENFLVMIVSAENHVGIDIEKLKPRRFFSRIARRYFDNWEQYQNESQFYRSFTAREAFSKALGIGLAQTLSRVCIRRDNDDMIMGFDNNFSHRVTFFEPMNNFLAAICRRRESQKPLQIFDATDFLL